MALIFGIFGLIIGSFLNVLVIRWGNKGLGGRSACMHCEKTLSWFDMVPVVSWFLLRGKCRSCATPISIQYPVVEALCGILFYFIGGAALVLPAKLIALTIGATLLAIAVYDLRTTYIPDAWSYTFMALALALQFLYSDDRIFSLWGGPIAALPLFILWLLSRGAWMGFGDVKLALGIGWLLAPIYGLAAIFFAFIIGGVTSLPLLLFSSDSWKRYANHASHKSSAMWGQWVSKTTAGFTMKSEIPFGPFLILSTIFIWISLIYGHDPLAPWAYLFQ